MGVLYIQNVIKLTENEFNSTLTRSRSNHFDGIITIQ